MFYCSHWGGGSDVSVANGEVPDGGNGIWAYYGLKNQAKIAGEPVIFVSPNGPYDQTAHTLLDDLLAFLENELCIDRSRIFATGFSYGAMISYSLSLNHQSVLRAVTALSPANYNIYLPTDAHKPIAYMSTTGMSDGTCPWDGGNGKGAKYAALGHAQDNGCDIPAEIPTTKVGSKTYLCYDFVGCDPGYPVRVCTFDGGHVAAHVDGTNTESGTKTWIPKATWDFWSQF